MQIKQPSQVHSKNNALAVQGAKNINLYLLEIQCGIDYLEPAIAFEVIVY